jgi:hypothetical protein
MSKAAHPQNILQDNYASDKVIPCMLISTVLQMWVLWESNAVLKTVAIVF